LTFLLCRQGQCQQLKPPLQLKRQYHRDWKSCMNCPLIIVGIIVPAAEQRPQPIASPVLLQDTVSLNPM
jgi:hypothetical protein